MANDLLTQPDTESHAAAASADGNELDLAFGVARRGEAHLIELYESIRDIFFPPKLPPLELTSTPIPVPDRMAVKRNPWAVGISATINLIIVLIALFFLWSRRLLSRIKPH